MARPFMLEVSVGLQLQTGAAASPVSVAAAKAHIGIESADWDSQLEDWITVATCLVQDYIGKAVGGQTWKLTLDRFTDQVELSFGPVTEIGVIQYIDPDRVVRTLDDAVYIHDLVSVPQRLFRDPEEDLPSTANVPNAVTINFTTGFETGPELSQIRQAILMSVASMYRDRDSGGLTPSVAAMLRPLRRIII